MTSPRNLLVRLRALRDTADDLIREIEAAAIAEPPRRVKESEQRLERQYATGVWSKPAKLKKAATAPPATACNNKKHKTHDKVNAKLPISPTP